MVRLPTAYCLLIVGLLALGVRLAFGFRAPPFVTNDSLSYLLPGFDLARGLEFAPLLKRPPLYPLFVGGVIVTLGEELRVLMLAQHLLGVATALGAFGIGALVFGRAAGLLAGIVTALSGPLLIMEQYLMSETLFGTLLVAAVLAYLLGLQRASLRWLALAGAVIGLATLTRPIGQLAAAGLAAAIPLLAGAWDNQYRERERAARDAPRNRAARSPSRYRFVAVFLGAFALTVLPWMARNALVQGTFAVAGGMGEGLAVRTIRYDQQFDFREPPGDDQDRVVARARRIYRDEAREGSAFELAHRLREELGVSEVQADRLMRQIALEAIARQPLYYLQGTGEMFWRTFAGRPVRLRQDWTPWRNIAWEPRVAHLLPSPTAAEDRSFAAAEALATLYDPARFPFVAAALFALGTLWGLQARFRPALLLGGLVLGLLLASAALIGIEWRYRYPLDPIITVLSAGGLVATWQWARLRAARGAWRATSRDRVPVPAAESGQPSRLLG